MVVLPCCVTVLGFAQTSGAGVAADWIEHLPVANFTLGPAFTSLGQIFDIF